MQRFKGNIQRFKGKMKRFKGKMKRFKSFNMLISTYYLLKKQGNIKNTCMNNKNLVNP